MIALMMMLIQNADVFYTSSNIDDFISCLQLITHENVNEIHASFIIQRKFNPLCCVCDSLREIQSPYFCLLELIIAHNEFITHAALNV